MKTIESIQIWDNGQIKIANVLNASGVNVSLNQSATFYYELFTLGDNGNIGDIIAHGNIFMPTEDYLQWSQDEFAWDFVANSLNLTITGDFTPPQIIEQPDENNPESL